MKKLYSHKIGIAALAAAVLFIFVLLHSVSMQDQKTPELGFPEYVNQAEMANACNLDKLKLPTETVSAVYRLKKPDTAQDQENIRKALGLEENAKFGTLSDPAPVSSEAVLGYDADTGYWVYQTDLAYDTGENVPDEQEALRIASDFISSLYPAELLGTPAAVADISAEWEGHTSEVVRWNVSYYPTVENQPVYGVFRICIAVGANGKIVEVEKLAGEYEKVAEVPLADLQTVKNNFAAQKFLCIKDERPQNPAMEQAELGFYADAESEYLQPVYVISNADKTAEILIDAQDR